MSSHRLLNLRKCEFSLKQKKKNKKIAQLQTTQ